MTSEDFRATVGENIRAYRLMNKLSQMALAEKADLSVGYLHALEAGTKWGMPETIVKLAAALHVHPSQFYATSEESKNSISSDLVLLSNALKQNIDTTIADLVKKYS